LTQEVPIAPTGRTAIHDAGRPLALRALAPPDPRIALWLCELERDPAEVDACAQSLTPDERDRAARFGRESLRSRWIVGRATLRLLLAGASGVDPADIRLVRGVRGRPELAGPPRFDFNLSHTDGMALIGIGHALPPHARIGVDIERADRVVNADGLARKFLTERERAMLAVLSANERRISFLRLWTCKESMSKATGDALSAPFRDIDIDLAGAPVLRGGPPPYTSKDWRLFAAEVDATHIATVALWKAAG
jgi:4'-phosphopantetheinyl transferase